MKTKIWYSVQNYGDGSAYPEFMESEELCEIDQQWMEEGWGEFCVGCLIIESESPIKAEDVTTIEDVIKELKEDLNEDYMKDCFKILKGKLKAVEELRDRVKK